MSLASLDLLKKRLLYQSQHRGTREMDLLLGTFAAQALPSMTYKETKVFEGLLALSDHELYEWLRKAEIF